MPKTVAIVDLSWEMHRQREALKMLSVERVLPTGNKITVPTGHVYGTLQDIHALSKQVSAVFLAVDSPCPARKELLAQYKSDRHTPTGDPFVDYNIYNDLRAILSLLTATHNNVFYVKEDGMEADDIIASFLKKSLSNDTEYSVYMRDKDILITRGRYMWFDKFTGQPIDRRAYIEKACGFTDSQFDNFPLAVKVITGDASDKIPNRIPRFPKNYLQQVCSLVPEDDYSFESIIKALIDVRSEMNATWKGKLAMLENPESELVKNLNINYRMTCPIHRDPSTFRYKGMELTSEEVSSYLNQYQIKEEIFF